MIEILTSEFFWGIVVGLLLSILGSYFLAKFTVRNQQDAQRKLVKRLCRDTATNISEITTEFERLREKTDVIFYDYLNLIDVEIQVFGRNREHMVLLSESEASAARNFFTEVAMRRAEVLQSLNDYYKNNELSAQVKAAGNGPASQDLARLATRNLELAHKASEKLVTSVKNVSNLLSALG